MRGVSIENPPFGPENVPAFEELFAIAGFPLPYEPIIPPGFQFPKTEQMTIGVSHQFSPTLAFDVDYIHSHGDERGKVADLNERHVRGSNASRLFYPGATGTAPRHRVTAASTTMTVCSSRCGSGSPTTSSTPSTTPTAI